MIVGILVLALIVAPVAYLILIGVGSIAVIGGSERGKKKSLARKEEILSAAFDGRTVVTIPTGMGNLPFETVMEEAPRYGYRFVSDDAGSLVLTCVFERINDSPPR